MVHVGSLFSFELTGLKVFSLIQLENTLLIVCLSLFVSKLVRQASEARTMYTGGFLFVIGYSVISYSNSLVVIIAAMLLATIGELLHIPTRQAYLSQIVKDGARSSYMAVNGLFFNAPD